jgi:hypothetical protein
MLWIDSVPSTAHGQLRRESYCKRDETEGHGHDRVDLMNAVVRSRFAHRGGEDFDNPKAHRYLRNLDTDAPSKRHDRAPTIWSKASRYAPIPDEFLTMSCA